MADAEAPPAKVPRTRSPSPLSAEAALESEAPVAARQFSDETWAEIMLHCSIFDLFCLRDTCHRFRTMIDREMLEGALVDAGMDRIFPQREQEREYLPICGTWSALPPASSDLKIRLCGSTDCSSYMFSEHMSRGWRFCCKPGTDYTYYDDVVEFVLPPAAEMWQPHMLMDIGCYVDDWHYAVFQDIDGSTNCRAVLKARLQAKKELDSIGWKGDVHSDIIRDSKDKEGAKRLAAIYCIYLIWRIRNEEKCTKVRQDNLQAIEASAKSLNQPYSPNHPVIQRVLEAHARDVSTILPPAARSLFPLPDIPATPWRPNGHQLAQESALCQAGSTQEGSGATAPPSPPKPASRATGASRGACRAALSRSTTSAPKPAQATARPLGVASTTLLWSCTLCAGRACFVDQLLLLGHKRDV
ncbi:hypothetical protein K523DRAFT_376325 [Schizophyllum commune Tattone D]|nr:hypothetical protein K523DRAFT_376325 [Schizophyllum commune Tattone D]